MADKGLHEYVMSEVLQGIEGITSRAMFGGYGIYQHGVFFALIADGRLYFKVDETNKRKFENMGSSPFVYGMKGKQTVMSYYELPEQIMEDKDEIGMWVQESFDIAFKGKKK